MASLKELKGRINSVKSTQKITKAKQMVAAAKLRKAQASAEAARPYAARLAEVMGSLASRIVVSESSPKLLAGTGKDQVHLLVVANSDRGLCGAFNANIVKAARLKAQSLEAEGKTVLFDSAHLFYSKFRSALLQEPTEKQIIPVPVPTDVHVATGGAVVEYEPDEEEILAALLPRYLKTQLFGALLENMASEQGASMTAMDNATRNAGELIGKLTIQYNRSRQAAITTELIEIIAGAEAL